MVNLTAILLLSTIYGFCHSNLSVPDEYVLFRSQRTIYHDEVSEYAANESFRNGTVSAVFYLASIQKESLQVHSDSLVNSTEIAHGAIIRGDKKDKRLALVFTGHEYADGVNHIIEVLRKNKIKASFFLTGCFYRNQEFNNIIKTLKNQNHYLGAHSDAHLLYCDWKDRENLLVSKIEFTKDLFENYQIMETFGIVRQEAPYFLPPYEWYNSRIADWTAECGLQLINYTPGTLSHADYTWPAIDMGYFSSDQILESIINYSREHPDGLNGFILLMHIGTSPKREDKFYFQLDTLIKYILKQGYQPVRIDELLGKYPH